MTCKAVFSCRALRTRSSRFLPGGLLFLVWFLAAVVALTGADLRATLDGKPVPRFEALCEAILSAGLHRVDYLVQAMTSSMA